MALAYDWKCVHVKGNVYKVEDDDGRVIAFDVSRQAGRLIGAAPELLEALEDAYEELKEINRINPNIFPSEPEVLLDLIEAALARAKTT